MIGNVYGVLGFDLLRICIWQDRSINLYSFLTTTIEILLHSTAQRFLVHLVALSLVVFQSALVQ